MLRVYNTLNDAKEEFVPIRPGEVGMYVCGVTVYDDSHIGHARGAVVFDVIRRYLKYKGWKVTYVRNFTDVDDKIINRAREKGVSWEEIAKRYILEFHKDMAALGVAGADLEPKATEHIREIIDLIERLVQGGVAYVSEGDVLFAVDRFEGYGKLSKRKLDDLLAGARVEIDKKKKNPLDFTLWKSSKEGEPSWGSPWGPGRPGWHIECSAMSQAHLGETFDIHGGGKDLIFPHHENEIAQSEASTGKPYVKYWLHNGFVNIDQEKMSKSLGNFFTVKDVLSRFDPETVRLFLLSTHYRSPVDFSDRNLEDTERARRRVYHFLQKVERALERGEGEPDSRPGRDESVYDEIDKMGFRFEAAMDDDFNTARTLGNVFENIRLLNSLLQGANQRDRKTLSVLRKFKENLQVIGSVLGLFLESPDQVLKGDGGKGSLSRDEIHGKIELRIKARKNKEWAESDRIRDELSEKGVVLKDLPDGTTDWEWKQ